jgi:asparagine synthase (glutamine-hydrolysing)
LSVIDLALSRQPLLSADGEIAVVFNGEIYNFRELRRELSAQGHIFTTQGDGEVLVHGWRQWGPDLLAAVRDVRLCLVGPRALGTFSRSRSSRCKPLYYAWHAGIAGVRLGVEVAVAVSGSAARTRSRCPGLYLECQYIPAPHSIYATVRKLPAGQWLSVRDRKLTNGSFWRPSYIPKHAFDDEAAIDGLDAQLKRSVASMLVADVPLGALSAAASIRVSSRHWRPRHRAVRSTRSISASPATMSAASTRKRRASASTLEAVIIA